MTRRPIAPRAQRACPTPVSPGARWVMNWYTDSPDPKRRRVRTSPALRVLGELLEAATGDYGSARVAVSVHNLHQLGRALRRIERGEDARHVFGQTGTRGRQNQQQEQFTRALAYWTARAQNLPEAEAIRAAATHFPGRTLRPASIRKYAQQHAEWLLERLPHVVELQDIPAAELTRRIQALRDQRHTYGRRGKWETKTR